MLVNLSEKEVRAIIELMNYGVIFLSTHRVAEEEISCLDEKVKFDDLILKLKGDGEMNVGMNDFANNTESSGNYYLGKDREETRFEAFHKVLAEVRILAEANNVSLNEFSAFLIGERSDYSEKKAIQSADSWAALITERLREVLVYLEENRRLIESIRKQFAPSNNFEEVIKKLRKEGEANGRKG